MSIEIIIIALGTVVEQTLPIQILVVSFVAVIATIGVYGIVALIIRMDDVGFKMIEVGEKNGKKLLSKIGQYLVQALPKVIKALTVIGTLAMLLVAGGIFVHNVESIHHIIDFMPSITGDLLVGAVVGAIAVLLEKGFMKVKESYS